jgi:hypothetical protein
MIFRPALWDFGWTQPDLPSSCGWRSGGNIVKAFIASAVVLVSLIGPATAECDRYGQPIVCELSGYLPEPYSPPRGTCPARQQSDVVAVQRAFGIAPEGLKREICGLTKLFVTDGDFSWGVWENPLDQTTEARKPDTYVGMSRQVIASDLKSYLDSTLEAVLIGRNPNINHSVSDVDDEGSRALAGLSVLAHEVGHIKWHRDNIYSSLPCYYGAFIFQDQEKSWMRGQGLTNSIARRWHPGPDNAAASGGASHARGVPHPKQQRDLPPGLVRQIYEGGFASAFASLSPEEDFVETYVFSALKSSSITNF